MKKIAILLILSSLIFSCSGKDVNKMSANELFSMGLSQFKAEDYGDASKLFEKSIMKADSPELASKAQLFLADSYFMMEDYAQAIPSYEQYLNIYEGSKSESKVIKRLATSYYRLTHNVDRDQTNTRKALKYYNKLQDKFPGYSEHNKIEKRIMKLRNKLATKEMYVADFYFRTGKDEAAAERLEYIINNYKETNVFNEAAIKFSEYLIDKDKDTDKAVKYLNTVMKREGGVKYLSRISKMLEKVKTKIGSDQND